MIQAIIPARGGSKGLRGKNLATLGGKSLLAIAIEACQAAKLVQRVVVTTDSDEITAEAERCGAIVCRRPKYLGLDDSPVHLAIQHCLRKLPSQVVALVQCTSPMIQPEDIDGCIEKLERADLAICCVPFDGLVIDSKARAVNLPMDHAPNRQQRESQWQVAGNCWAFRSEYIKRLWMSGRVAIQEASFPRHLEIDGAADMEIARAIVELRARVVESQA